MTGTILAIGGLTGEHNEDRLHSLVLDSSKRRKPRVCYVPITSGGFEQYIEFFYDQYPTSVCEPRHLELLRNVSQDPKAALASQDIVYLGGGSTPVLIAALRILGLVEVLHDVWERTNQQRTHRPSLGYRKRNCPPAFGGIHTSFQC